MTDRSRDQAVPLREDDDATARLLRLAGPRPDVAADRAARVRSAVHAHWRAKGGRRAIRRRAWTAAAVLAAAAMLLVMIRILPRRDTGIVTPNDVVARIERIDEGARVVSGDGGAARPAASAGSTLATGEWLQTDGTARAALRLPGGTSVRVDVHSRVRLLSAAIIDLSQGALYVDTGRDSTGLEVRTPHGTAHDIGTQFEVRLYDASLRVRVRTGLVELRRENRSIPARAGTEVTVGAGDPIRRTAVAFGPEWEWAASLAPSFDIEGRPLAAFLEHLAREHGWTIRYADGALARDASSMILHGSVAGLQPEEAIDVALRTSGLAHRFENGDVLVFRRRDRD